MGVTNWYSKKPIILDKIYKDDKKFGGMGDNFNFKVLIFLDKYKQIGLLADSYI